MAQVTYQAAGAGSNTTGNPTPGYPAGLVANDLILLQVLVGDITNTPTTPTGWTLLYGPHSMSYDTGYPRTWIYGRISDGTETGNLTVTCSGAAEKAARMYSFRNNATSAYNESGGWGAGAADPVPMQSVTTSVNEGLAVAFVTLLTISENPGSATGETGGDWIEAVAEYEAGNLCMQLQTATMATAGTISGGSIDLSTSRYYGVRAFGIKPAAGATPINVSDTGSGVDAISLAAEIAQTDSGSGNDAAVIAAALSQSDTGSGVDAISLAAEIAQTDSGSGNDALTLSISLSQTDNGSGADDVNVAVSGQVSIADAGSGAEVVSLAVNASINDAGGGTDDFIISVSLSANDAGAGVDILNISALIAMADSGIGEDILSNIAAMINIDEITIGAESMVIAASLNVQDAGAGADSILIDTGAIVAAIIKMAGVTLTQPKMAGVTLTQPKMAGVTLTQPKMHDIRILN